MREGAGTSERIETTHPSRKPVNHKIHVTYPIAAFMLLPRSGTEPAITPRFCHVVHRSYYI